MPLQDLQTDVALLGRRPQGAAVFHRHRPRAGRAALRQQSLSSPGLKDERWSLTPFREQR